MPNLAQFTGLAAAAVLLSCRAANPSDHMRAHYQRAGVVQAKVVRGDLVQAKDAARWVAEHEQATGMPPAAAPFVGQMRDAAGEVARAGTLSEAALATGRMGATCGSCHQATNAGVRIAVVTAPEQGAGPASGRMKAHYWGAERLWDGLVGPSDESWLAGAGAIADSAGWNAVFALTGARATDARVLAGQLQTLGRRALAARGQGDRAAIHGEVLATCNGCHSLLNVQVE
jgi:hypothetical protein